MTILPLTGEVNEDFQQWKEKVVLIVAQGPSKEVKSQVAEAVTLCREQTIAHETTCRLVGEQKFESLEKFLEMLKLELRGGDAVVLQQQREEAMTWDARCETVEDLYKKLKVL